MASITIRNLDDDIKQRLRVRAAEHGRSMEEEARDILRRVMSDTATPRDLATSIRARVTLGVRADLELPAREQRVEIRVKGQKPIIAPIGQTWDSFFLVGPRVSNDFLSERASQEQPEREAL